ncbi:hypothetical protein BDY19DRAFT_1051624 [Irpex rosettiformis]|uniref:Uncharacterized protein n=1 Tax=Irpex rosettiformis TaxID=378272 RepID=A0ACB8TPI3_9APHY|nr:hypothetical protein BDY19DRAFT_1051624 [Irpex rosettiformis]
MRLSGTTIAIAMLAAQPAFSIPFRVLLPPNGLNPIPTASHPAGYIFANKVHSLRDVDRLMQRDEFAGFVRELEDLFARADDDESGAINLFQTAKNAFKIISTGLDGLNIISNLSPGSSEPQPSATPSAPARRDFNELDARVIISDPIFTPIQAKPPSSTARPQQINSNKIQLLNSFTGNPEILRDNFNPKQSVARELEARSVSPTHPPITFSDPESLLKKIQQDFVFVQRREFVELLARQLADDESGASLASTLSKAFSTVKSIISDGKTLGKVADGASIASSVSNVVGGLAHPAPPAQSQAPRRRELIDSLLARAMEAREMNGLE